MKTRLLTKDAVQDFDLELSHSQINTQRLFRLDHRPLTLTTPESLDEKEQKTLDEILLQEPNRMRDAGYYLSALGDYFLQILEERLQKTGLYDEVGLMRQPQGTVIESEHYLFTFQNPNGISSVVTNKLVQGRVNFLRAVLLLKKDGFTEGVVLTPILTSFTDYLGDRFEALSRRLFAAKELLRETGNDTDSIRSLLCLPKDIMRGGLTGRNREYCSLLEEYSLFSGNRYQKLLLAFSTDSYRMKDIAKEQRNRWIEQGRIHSPYSTLDWENRAKMHAGFLQSDSAYQILRDAYLSIKDCHDSLIKMIDADAELKKFCLDNFWEQEFTLNDELRDELSLLYRRRLSLEGKTLSSLNEIYRYLKDLPAEDTLKALEGTFHAIPTPTPTNGIRELSDSIYGDYVLPTSFIRGFKSYLDSQMSDLQKNPNFVLTLKNYEGILNEFVRYATSDTKDGRRDVYAKMTRVGGSFESRK